MAKPGDTKMGLNNPKQILRGVVGNNNPSTINRRMFSDRDGDKVMNVYDCQPSNPHKQGILHTVGAAIVRGVGMEKTAERIKERGEEYNQQREKEREVNKEIRQKAFDAALKKRETEAIKTAEHKEALRAQAQRERISSPGLFLGAVTKELVRPLRAPQRSIVKRKTKYVKIPGKKGYKKVVSYTRASSNVSTTRQPSAFSGSSLSDYISGTSNKDKVNRGLIL